eukprot:1299006-Alexandrium_andersonii.AAC.1
MGVQVARGRFRGHGTCGVARRVMHAPISELQGPEAEHLPISHRNRKQAYRLQSLFGRLQQRRREHHKWSEGMTQEMCAIYRSNSAYFCEAVDTSLVCVLGEAAFYGTGYLNSAHEFAGHEQ